MSDTSKKNVQARFSPHGEMGQKYLVSGKRVSRRLWALEPGGEMKHPTKRYYETVGFVISGSAKLEIEGQMLSLKSGDSWLVLPEPSINTPFSNLSGLLRRPRRQPRFMAAMSPSDTNYSVAEPHEPRT